MESVRAGHRRHRGGVQRARRAHRERQREPLQRDRRPERSCRPRRSPPWASCATADDVVTTPFKRAGDVGAPARRGSSRRRARARRERVAGAQARASWRARRRSSISAAEVRAPEAGARPGARARPRERARRDATGASRSTLAECCAHGTAAATGRRRAGRAARRRREPRSTRSARSSARALRAWWSASRPRARPTCSSEQRRRASRRPASERRGATVLSIAAAPLGSLSVGVRELRARARCLPRRRSWAIEGTFPRVAAPESSRRSGAGVLSRCRGNRMAAGGTLPRGPTGCDSVLGTSRVSGPCHAGEASRRPCSATTTTSATRARSSTSRRKTRASSTGTSSRTSSWTAGASSRASRRATPSTSATTGWPRSSAR